MTPIDIVENEDGSLTVLISLTDEDKKLLSKYDRAVAALDETGTKIVLFLLSDRKTIKLPTRKKFKKVSSTS